MAGDRRALRLGVLATVAVVLVGLLGVRLWFLQTVRADELQARVDRSRTRVIQLAPERGRIFDADGRILADNERILTVAVDWRSIERSSERAVIFDRLSEWLEVPASEMEDRYDAGFYSPFLPLPLAEDVDEPTAIAILERVEDMPGVEIVNEWKRVYPYAPHAAHVVGYMGAITADQLEDYLVRGYLRNERVGQFGIERSMEEVLHGTWGYRVLEVDATNRPVRVVEEVPPINGFDVQLTLDLDVQVYVEQALETSLRSRRTQYTSNPLVRQPDGTLAPLDPTQPEVVPYKAPAGSAVVKRFDTGEVIAMASYPTFDNRWFEAGISGTKFREIFPSTKPDGSPIDPDESILVNRAVQGRYNLGSTFKPFTAYAALHTGLITPDETYVDTGTYELYSVNQDRCARGLIRCVFKNALCGTGAPCVYGEVDVEDALAVSSDAFFYRIGEEILVQNDGEPVFQEEIRAFGFGSDTGIELPYEYDGTVPDKELKRSYAERGVITEDEGRGFYVGDSIQMAIGQGLLSATPIQLNQGYGTIANAGVVVQPTLIAAIWEPGTSDGAPGYADLASAELHEPSAAPIVVRDLEMEPELLDPIVTGLTRVVTTGAGVPGTDIAYHSTTGEKLFYDYPDDAIPVAGKTGTAQGAGNFPWNDSSAFTAFSLDRADPFVVTAYLEKAGYGSQAAAPVVKCTFLMLSGKVRTDPVRVSEPLDVNATVAAPPQLLDDVSCFNRRGGG
ncbi:MAG: penicillin-binding transpeptidase domain-containing protein, partial [Actinomycetota bacterium]|nr:penicillin-binding transpeptidase domain-containing protein [Actinomycetota bacterium]